MHLWEIEHPYYCEESNFYASLNSQPSKRYGSWAEFYRDKGESDPDMNLLFRWDWRLADPECLKWHNKKEELVLYWMGQRRGLYNWSYVEVTAADEPVVTEWLKARFEHLKKLWEPFGDDRTHPYCRIVEAFDKSPIANSFLAQDGEGGFAAGIHRMAMAIEQLRAREAELEAHCDRLGQGGAERYWEGRWRDEAKRVAELEALAREFVAATDWRDRFNKSLLAVRNKAADLVKGLRGSTEQMEPEENFAGIKAAARQAAAPVEHASLQVGEVGRLGAENATSVGLSPATGVVTEPEVAGARQEEQGSASRAERKAGSD